MGVGLENVTRVLKKYDGSFSEKDGWEICLHRDDAKIPGND